jgi:hypothetical protein
MLIGNLPSDSLLKSLILHLLGKVIYHGTLKANTDEQASNSNTRLD